MTQRVLWINPLGTDVFDEPIRDELERVKLADTEVEVRSLERGPHHLEYSCYEAAAVPDILALLAQAEGEGFDAAVIGCFYDTALRPAREITSRMAVAAPASQPSTSRRRSATRSRSSSAGGSGCRRCATTYDATASATGSRRSR